MSLILNRSKVGQKDRFWIKDESDEIDYDSSKQAFEIPRFNPRTVDLNKVPSNAQEYLEQVITQRLTLPKAVTSKIPDNAGRAFDQKDSTKLKKLEKEQPKQVSAKDDKKNKPTIDWTKKEIAKFDDLRTFVNQVRHLFESGYYRPEWPLLSDKKGWLKYLYSYDHFDDDDDDNDKYSQESEVDDVKSDHDDNGNVEDYIDDNSDVEDYVGDHSDSEDYDDRDSDVAFENDMVAVSTTIEKPKYDNASVEKEMVNGGFNPTPPLVSTILSMSETLKENLIGYIAEWVSDGILTIYSGSFWLYALFACIQYPPSPNVIHYARIVAKTAIKLRKKMEIQNTTYKREVIAQNLMICIISKFLGQCDLADYDFFSQCNMRDPDHRDLGDYGQCDLTDFSRYNKDD